MKLFACMCNQPQRLPAAIAPVREALVVVPPISRWGLGYIQGGDTLLVRTPKASAVPVDLSAPLARLSTDCAIAQAVTAVPLPDGERYGGPDNTPPFRFRRWLYAQSGLPELAEIGDVSARLLAIIPEYLRRNLKGRTPAELMFHVFLALLHDEGSVEDPNLAVAATRRALGSAMTLLSAELARAGHPAPAAGNLAVTNGRSMVVVRLAETLRMRRLTVDNDRGERDESFRGVLLVSDATAAATGANHGFEDVPLGHAVLVSREVQVQVVALADP